MACRFNIFCVLLRPKYDKMTEYPALNLPEARLPLRESGGRWQVLCLLRQRWVRLTPEEWVRQHFCRYLVSGLGYPRTLLANEQQLSVGEKRLRCDTVLYDRHLRPRMIVEYKAPTVPVTEQVFRQVVAYNIVLHADYLVVSNGLTHYCCQMDYVGGHHRFLTAIPPYATIVQKESVAGS